MGEEVRNQAPWEEEAPMSRRRRKPVSEPLLPQFRPVQDKLEGVQYPLIQLMADIRGWTRMQTMAEMTAAYQHGLDWSTTSVRTATGLPGTLATATSLHLLHQLKGLAYERGWPAVAREIDRAISDRRFTAARSRPVHGFPRALEGVETFRRSSNQRTSQQGEL